MKEKFDTTNTIQDNEFMIFLSKGSKGDKFTYQGYNDVQIVSEIQRYGLLEGDLLEIQGYVGGYIIIEHQHTQVLAVEIGLANHIFVLKA